MSGREPDPGGPWSQARRQARADVAAALATGRRLCPGCGAAVEGPVARTCPRCGSELTARRPRRGASPRWVAATVLTAGLLAVPLLVFFAGTREQAAREAGEAARRQDALVAAETNRLRREGRPRTRPLAAFRPPDEPGARARHLRSAERLITVDARARVRAGRLEGPVIATRCRPEPRTATRAALEQEPRPGRLAYSCVALNSRFEVPPSDGRRYVGLLGHPYRAVIDERRRTVTWCRVFPPAGEGARSMSVALPPACRATPPAAGAGPPRR